MRLWQTSALPCVILAIDAAQKSGWAVLRPRLKPGGRELMHKVVASGVVKADRPADCMAVITTALGEPMHHSLHLSADQEPVTRPYDFVVAIERSLSIPGREKSRAVATGLGANVGRWRTYLDLCEVPKARRIELEPRDWRRSVYGSSSLKKIARPALGAGLDPSRIWKDIAVTRARAVWHYLGSDPDEAEAILIGEWATRAAKVRSKKMKKTTLRAWGLEM